MDTSETLRNNDLPYLEKYTISEEVNVGNKLYKFSQLKATTIPNILSAMAA
jgi:hypothetical protein